MSQSTPKVIVAVSPFYRGLGWKDEGTGITFKADVLMKHYSIPKTKDLSGIAKQIHLNNLILVEGDLEIPDVIYDAEDEVQNLESEVSTLENDKTNLQNQIQLLKQEIQELQGIIDNLGGSVEGLSETDEVYTEEMANALKVAEIKAELDKLEIEYSAGAVKAELVSLLIGQPL